MGQVLRKIRLNTNDPKNVYVSDDSEDPARKFDPTTDAPGPPMLWDEHGPTNPALDSTDSDHHHELVITRREKEVDGGFDHPTKAEIIRTDLQGKIVQRVLIYEGTSPKTVDSCADIYSLT